MANGFFRNMMGWVGLVLRPEKLDEIPEAPVGPARRSFTRWLFTAEKLPLDESVAAGRSGSLFSRLFALEYLPLEHPPARLAARRSVFATIFSGERLPASQTSPRDPEVASRR